MAAIVMMSTAPLVYRAIAHAEHSIERALPVLGEMTEFWSHVLLATIVFMAIAAFSAVADRRLLDDLLRGRLASMLQYLAQGFRAFFKLLRDRETPYTARALLGLALVYWLSSPWEVFPDSWRVPGFLDELVVTLAATKAFVYLCPEWLVTRHAAPGPS